MSTVLLTDYPWPDNDIERAIIEAAGHRFVAGPSATYAAEEVNALVRAHAPAAIMVCWADVSAEAVNMPPALKIVHRLGVGLDNIAVDAATARSAWVTNVPGYCAEEVSDHAVALMLALERGLVSHDRAVHRGEWNPAGAHLRRISQLTVGVLGFGRTGSATLDRLAPFGVRRICHTRTPPVSRPAGVEFVSMDELVTESDAVIIHAPLTDRTRHLFDQTAIARMKKGATLVNVSRGAIIDTGALIAALDSGHLGGAGLDVVEGEPSPPAALLAQDNVIITPHIAFTSAEALEELRRLSAEEVVRVLAGEPPLQPCNTPVRG